MDANGPQDPAAEESRERARAYESIHNRLFVVRIVFTFAVLALYQFSGASPRLAAGLYGRFDAAWGWPVAHALYLLITLFGFSAITFPLSLYAEHILEHRFGLSRQSFESWMADYFKSLVLELAVGVVFFSAVYAFLHVFPGSWWLWASIFYVLFAVVLTSVAPVLILPLFHKFEPLEDAALTDAARDFAQSEGLRVVGVFRWGLAEKTSTANAALAGLGRTRRIILGDTLLQGYERDEILAVLAHEVGHYKHKDLPRMTAASAVLATAGFYIAHRVLATLTAGFGFDRPGDIGAFPLFVFCLFVFSLIAMPLSNAYSRRREFAADAYAVRRMGSAEPLARALEKLADQNLDNREPAAWIEFLLHSHPSIGRRVERARARADPSAR